MSKIASARVLQCHWTTLLSDIRCLADLRMLVLCRACGEHAPMGTPATVLMGMGFVLDPRVSVYLVQSPVDGPRNTCCLGQMCDSRVLRESTSDC
jgi:hypothetical protein